MTGTTGVRVPATECAASPWASALRAYITVTAEHYPRVVDAPGWVALGDYLTGPEFGALAGSVVSITIISRDAAWGEVDG